ncbi:hypothetical protein [Ruminococcus sp.]|nr:hypothetical protein [Ruminococcus sp.]
MYQHNNDLRVLSDGGVVLRKVTMAELPAMLELAASEKVCR